MFGPIIYRCSRCVMYMLRKCVCPCLPETALEQWLKGVQAKGKRRASQKHKHIDERGDFRSEAVIPLSPEKHCSAAPGPLRAEHALPTTPKTHVQGTSRAHHGHRRLLWRSKCAKDWTPSGYMNQSARQRASGSATKNQNAQVRLATKNTR